MYMHQLNYYQFILLLCLFNPIANKYKKGKSGSNSIKKKTVKEK